MAKRVSMATSSTQGMEDRISNLPANLLDHIMCRISVRDSARTSVLSKSWRYTWATQPLLLLDNQFFIDVINPEAFAFNYEKECVNIINKILSVYRGPLLKFVLHIPYPLDFDNFPDIDRWLLDLSSNGTTQAVAFDNSYNNVPYKLPTTSLFSSTTLKYIKLVYCILNQPPANGGFSKIAKLELFKISFTADLFGTLALPHLVMLNIKWCDGLEHLRVLKAPNLKMLRICNSFQFQWSWFDQNLPNLASLAIVLRKEVENAEQLKKSIDLIRLLEKLPRIAELHLDVCALQFLAPATLLPKRLPTVLEHLKHLCLTEFGFHDLGQIKLLLCLLRNSPNLRNIEIWSMTTFSDAMEPVLHYLVADCVEEILDGLKKVKIRFMKGLRVEMEFIKLLLARSPSLEKVILDQPRRDRDLSRQSNELMNFALRCSEAKIIFT